MSHTGAYLKFFFWILKTGQNRVKTKCFKRSQKDQDQAKCQADSNQEDSVFVRFETLRLWCFVTVLFCWTVILCYFVIFFFVALLLCNTLFLCYFVTAYGTQCLWNLENCDEDAQARVANCCWDREQLSRQKKIRKYLHHTCWGKRK